MNKKGFLLGEETVKMVIAVIVLIFLAGLLAKLYYGYQENKELEQAEATLERFKQEVKSGAQEYLVLNPLSSIRTKWWMITWDSESSEYMPDICENFDWDKCACICGYNQWDGLNSKDIAKTCDETGICIETPNDLMINNPSLMDKVFKQIKYAFKIKEPTTINIDYDKKEITLE